MQCGKSKLELAMFYFSLCHGSLNLSTTYTVQNLLYCSAILIKFLSFQFINW